MARTTTPRKTTTGTRAPRKTVASAASAKAAVTTSTPEKTIMNTSDAKILGKRELIDRVVTASGIKKRAAKPVIEAVLKELGDAFSRGDTLNLQPFGKGIVKSKKDLENAEVVEVRVRRSKTAIRAAEDRMPNDPLAEAAE